MRNLHLTNKLDETFTNGIHHKRHKILWDLEIQIDHLILARKPDQVFINKKKKLPQNNPQQPGEETWYTGD